jgi:hypothetical protein
LGQLTQRPALASRYPSRPVLEGRDLPDEFIDWLITFEKIFEHKKIPDQ